MPPHFPGRWLWPGLALLVGVAGMSAIWVAAAVLSGATCSWLALVAAVDMALLLRLTNAPPGRGRTAAAVLGTVATIVVAEWLVVATKLGVTMGLPPLDSARHLGPHLAWRLATLSLGRVDWVLLAAAPLLAAILASATAAPAAAERATSAPNPGT